MQKNSNNFKAKPQDVVFVTKQNITRWKPDLGNPDSTKHFLEDCRRSGWPIFELEGVAYVYATEGRA